MAGGNYPGGLDSFTANTDDVDDVLAADVNELQTAIVAIETELGTDPAGSATDVKTRLAHSINNGGYLEFDDCTELTISSGEITLTQNYHKLDTEGDASSDDLDTINGESAGLFIILRIVNDGRNVVVKHNTGNILCSGGGDITLDTTSDIVFGIYDDGQSKWLVFRGASSETPDLTGSPANNYIAHFTDADTLTGDDSLQWDGTDLRIGDGTSGRDYGLLFDGQDNDGIIEWREDEDYFEFEDDILMLNQEAIYFDSTDTYIRANTDSAEDLEIGADADILLQPDNQVIIEAVVANALTIGAGTADIDYQVTFNGETNDGVFIWKEDEDYFEFSDGILMNGAEEIYFRDTAISIKSGDDGHLDLTADTSIDLNTAADTDLVLNFAGTTNSGVITWMEDEDYFQFSDGILMLNQEAIYFDSTDTYIAANTDDPEDLVIAADQDILLQADNQVVTDTVIRGASTLFRRYYHLGIGSFDPGAAGATFTAPDANTIGGFQLDAAGEVLYFTSDVHADWDGASDLSVEIYFEINAASSENDTVDLQLICYYKGEGEAATKSQTLEEATNVGDGGAKAQYTMFDVTFTIDYDAVDNVVEAGDQFHFILNLETDTSEVDDIIVNNASFYYNTTHASVESGDV